MTGRRRRAKALVPWLPLVLFAGCVLDAVTPIPGAPCVDDSECGDPRFVCVIGVCVDPDNTALDEVHLEVRPADESGYEPQQLLDIPVTSERGRTVIELRPTVNVHGAVVDASLGGGVPADVIAVQYGGIQGRALVVTASTDMSNGAFSLPLVEHDAYALVFQPSDGARPPLFWERLYEVGPSLSGDQALQDGQPVTLPGADELLRITGRVTAGEGTAQLGVEGLEVRVVDGARRVSSVARTDALGMFLVSLPYGAAQVPLTLEVRPTQANRLNPTVRVDLGLVEDHQELGDVKLGALQAPVPFAGIVRGPGGDPVPNASLYVHAELGNGRFAALLTTDEEGRYDAELRPARYDFVVVAPPSDPTAGLLASYSAEVGGEAPAPVLNLPERLVLSGSVVDDEQAPVANATVQMTRVAGVSGVVEPLLEGLAWTFHAVTDDEGKWQQRVDPGRYRVVIVPDASTTRPRLTDLIDVDEEQDAHRFTLPPSSVVAGVVRGVANEAMGMATVTAYTSFSGESGAAIELGSAQTAIDGSFEILLPDLAPELP